jgi:hypothetical protein
VAHTKHQSALQRKRIFALANAPALTTIRHHVFTCCHFLNRPGTTECDRRVDCRGKQISQADSRRAAISCGQNGGKPPARNGSKLPSRDEFDFPSKQAQDDYHVHPLRVEFVEKVFKRVCKKAMVYDFE